MPTTHPFTLKLNLPQAARLLKDFTNREEYDLSSDLYADMLDRFCWIEEGDLVAHADSCSEGWTEDHPTGLATLTVQEIWFSEAGVIHFLASNRDEMLEDVILNDDWVRVEKDPYRKGRYNVVDRRALPTA